MTKRDCIERATQAIKDVCRELEPGGHGAVAIGDLATWEIEARIIEAVTKALEGRDRRA